MSTIHSSKSSGSAGIIVVSSIPIVLLMIGIIAMLGGAGRTDPVTGITHTTVDNAVLFGGLYFALPCGLLNIIVGIRAQSRSLLKKRFTMTGIIIGALGIIIGLLSWALFIMVSSFVF